MFKRLRATLATLALGLALGLTLTPSAFALDVSPDLFQQKFDEGLPGVVSPEECAQLDAGLSGALGCDNPNQVTDFTKFQGDFEGPDAAGYDSALTQTKNAREFIQTIVNFALSFLGLAATVLVIYGGGMYVLSRGDEDMASKGKKTIEYAATGIIIILGSFAIVNTLINATGGGNGAQVGTNESTNQAISSTGASFDVDGVLSELRQITEDYTENYDAYIKISAEINYMKSIEMPLVFSLQETDATVGGLVEFIGQAINGTDYSYQDTATLVDDADVDAYVDDLREEIGRIQRLAEPLSDTYEASQNLFNYLRTRSSVFNWLIPEAKASTDNVSIEELMNELSKGNAKGPGCASRSYDTEVRKMGVGVTIYDTNVSNIDDEICPMIDAIQLAADTDYAEKLDQSIAQLNELKLLFDLGALKQTLGAQNGSGSELSGIVDDFNQAEAVLTNAKTTITASTVRQVASAMNKLYTDVQNLNFVSVRMTASTLSGNAPLIVRFNALGTLDPSGQTVDDNQIFWDLNGDGKFNQEGDTKTEGDTVSFEYTDAGTYRAKVLVLSKDDKVAAGLATLTIQVNAPKSVIKLNATTGSETTVLADYGSFPKISKNDFKVTMAEANQGVVFDASASTDGGGESGGLVFATWNFGDNEVISGPWSTYQTITHKYGRPGTYDVTLTVTDQTGVEDRKTFKLHVASPAARINYAPLRGVVGTPFKFDGSGSTVDIGQIVSYQWSATSNGKPVTLPVSTGNTMGVIFDQPGIYNVTLTVVDSSGKEDQNTVQILVESQAPVASFEVSQPKSNQPGLLVLDASESYDPDTKDTLEFEWSLGGDEGDDYEILEEKENGSIITVNFLKAQTYKIELKVSDQHPENLKKTTVLRREIEVRSVLDVSIEVDGDQAEHLDQDGTATMAFNIETEHGTSVEVDFGDGEKAAITDLRNGKANVEHVYRKAGVYFVTATAYDDENKSNKADKRIYIGAGDDPIAVMNVGGDGQDIGLGPVLHGSVKTRFTFDAGSSLNTDGTSNNLIYFWNFGDGVTASQKTVTHVFAERATYQVTLTVKDKKDASKTSSASIEIEIEGIEPSIRSVNVVPQAASLQTPLKVTMNVDAVDEDGKITLYKAWYYDKEDSAEALGTVISQSPSFTLTINTKGEEGDAKEYGFAVEVTDNDNQTVSSEDELDADQIPSLEVVNGPNDTPVANFSVDRSAIFLGDEVTLSSTSYDPDGSIVSYTWDVEGDGFFNNEPQSSPSFTYTFDQVYREGVDVSLKVEDNSGATDISDPVRIYVDSKSEPPEAAFHWVLNGKTVGYQDASKADAKNNARIAAYFWDFDLSKDSSGNGKPDDDIDSDDPNPSFTYSAFGEYAVKLTVVDSTGQKDELTQQVFVQDAEKPKAMFTYEPDDKSITFENQSVVDPDLDIKSTVWDFNLNEDSDGDGNTENDTDSEKKNPVHEYASYGDYTVLLTVIDEIGQVSTHQEVISVRDPAETLTALMSSTPSANRLGQIQMQGESGDVTVYFSSQGGSGNATYTIDKNIFIDSNGDGIRDNDVDFRATRAGSARFTFYRTDGQTVIKLTAIDDDSGLRDIATLQVVFDGFLGGANLLSIAPRDLFFLLASTVLALTVALQFRFKPSRS